jgi:hypothetical protein
MLNSHSSKKALSPTTVVIDAEENNISLASDSSSEMRQLSAEEYAAVAGGPEMQVGDGGG